jgi:REP element-mobilizing transposase RayT
MALHRRITKQGIYFLTFTCYHWLPLIEITKGYELIYNWFNILIENGDSITCYVIMPNHIHLIMHFAGGKQSLNTVVGNGKRFIAYEIIKRLEKQGETLLLDRLRLAVRSKDKNRGKKHEVWMDAFDVKECRTEKFVLQKLFYIHNNPCTKRWKLAKEPHHFTHSSALFYLNGKQGYYTVRDYRDFLGMYRLDDGAE